MRTESIFGEGKAKIYTYKFRAECFQDVSDFVSKVKWYTENGMSGAKPVFAIISVIGNENVPDVTVIFKSSLVSLEIKQILSQLDDGHVMYETVELINNYTGVRLGVGKVKVTSGSMIFERLKTKFHLWVQRLVY